jgi:hypothetical protein
LAAALTTTAAAVAILAANDVSTSGDETLASSASNHFMTPGSESNHFMENPK